MSSALSAARRVIADRALPLGVAAGLVTLSCVFEVRGVIEGLGHGERSAGLAALVALCGISRAMALELPAISFLLVFGFVIARPRLGQRLGLLGLMILAQFTLEWVLGPWASRAGSELSAALSGDPARLGVHPMDITSWSVRELASGLRGTFPPGTPSHLGTEHVADLLWLRVASLAFVLAPAVGLLGGRRRLAGGHVISCWLATVVVTWAGSVAVHVLLAPRGGSIAWLCAPAALTAVAAFLTARSREKEPPPAMTPTGGLVGFVAAIVVALVFRWIPWQQMGLSG